MWAYDQSTMPELKTQRHRELHPTHSRATLSRTWTPPHLPLPTSWQVHICYHPKMLAFPECCIDRITHLVILGNWPFFCTAQFLWDPSPPPHYCLGQAPSPFCCHITAYGHTMVVHCRPSTDELTTNHWKTFGLFPICLSQIKLLQTLMGCEDLGMEIGFSPLVYVSSRAISELYSSPGFFGGRWAPCLPEAPYHFTFS